MPPDFDEAAFRSGFAEWTAAQIADPDGDSTTYVIEVDGGPVGRLRLVRTPEKVELPGLQLLLAFQSRGIGTRIITDLVAEATESGRPMTLTVEKANTRAQALYRRLGFTVIGEIDDEFVMRC
jgi:ribosomal protein S18 acetylase RimI-like enzyme